MTGPENGNQTVSLLERIVRSKRREVAERKILHPKDTMPIRPSDDHRDFAAALSGPGISVIAELKRRSPSGGVLCDGADPAKRGQLYQKAGADAVSVLTDGPFFGGKAEDILEVRQICTLPILRKDFIVDACQIAESRALGADAILLIVRILSQQQLEAFLLEATDLSLAALVEVHNAKELDCALTAGARIVGVNNRDLDTLHIDLRTSLDLATRIPDSCIRVSESGVRTANDVRKLADEGFNAVLVGETLMRSADPETTLRELKRGGGASVD